MRTDLAAGCRGTPARAGRSGPSGPDRRSATFRSTAAHSSLGCVQHHADEVQSEFEGWRSVVDLDDLLARSRSRWRCSRSCRYRQALGGRGSFAAAGPAVCTGVRRTLIVMHAGVVRRSAAAAACHVACPWATCRSRATACTWGRRGRRTCGGRGARGGRLSIERGVCVSGAASTCLYSLDASSVARAASSSLCRRASSVGFVGTCQHLCALVCCVSRSASEQACATFPTCRR
jgi:hypothetical protein